MCGGTHEYNGQRKRLTGLSPRVRGNLIAGTRDDVHYGSIPACAGEPGGCGRRGRAHQVYPRVCGGTPRGRPLGRGGRGLSPRVRGNPALNNGSGRWVGSIPACAGEPRLHGTRTHPPVVYPRVCGGTLQLVYPYDDRVGLSPRVRGNHQNSSTTTRSIGSIPACAGEP